MKTIRVSTVVYEMLQELPRKKRARSDLFVEMMIKEKYKRAQ